MCLDSRGVAQNTMTNHGNKELSPYFWSSLFLTPTRMAAKHLI